MSEGSDIIPSSKPKRWKNLRSRAISAITVAALTFVPFYFGGIYWAILVLILAMLMTCEWVEMIDEVPSAIAYGIPLLTLIASIIYAYNGNAIGVSAALLVGGVATLFEHGTRRGAPGWAVWGIFYIIVPSLAIIILRGSGIGFESYGFKFLFYIVLVVIAADTGAYFGGSYFQGPKLAPQLSPKKTWSGFLSGLVAGVLIGGLCSVFLKAGFMEAALVAIPIVILSVMGDFLESWIKRRQQVKDAGDIIPGHGGVLDRVDSLMIVMVVALVAPHLFNLSHFV